MAVKFETVKAGDRLWDCRMQRMGNTTMRKMGAWPVDVVSVDHEKGEAVVRWNCNAAKKVERDYFKSLRRTPAKGTYEREQMDKEAAS